VTQTSERRGPLRVALAAVLVVAVYIWDDVLFAAPIVAGVAAFGVWPAFVLFSVVYALGSYVIALWAVRAYDRASEGRPSRLASWLQRQQQRDRGRWGRRLLESGKLLGFVASSFLVGGILTTWFIRYSGRREGIRRIAAFSCAIFGVTFTAMYVGVGRLLFGA